MKKLFLLVVLLSAISFNAYAQGLCSQGTKYRNCRACGSATSTKGRALNLLKNRDAKANHPQKITVEQIRASNTAGLVSDKQVWVTGFVASLDKGGNQETCNCGRTDLRDIHINIVAKESERNDKTKYVVVEITPRWQAKLNLDDSDYDAMLEQVKNEIEHKWVKFEGWLMSDSYHVLESYNTAQLNTPVCKDDGHDPDPCIWRATTWEVHPVTKYTVVHAP